MERSIEILAKQYPSFSFYRGRSHLAKEIEENLPSNELPHAFDYYEYSIDTETDKRLKVNLGNSEGFFFLYSWTGNLSFRLHDKYWEILPFQSVILLNKYASEIVIELEREGNNHFCVISFKRPKGRGTTPENSFYMRFREMFVNHITKSDSIFIGQPYLKLLEKINDLAQMSQDNWSSKLIMQGMIMQILGLKMEQILDTFATEEEEYCSLTQTEIDRLQTVSHDIRENPSLCYSIDYFCKETGLSPSKLQEGFKKIHNRTVIDYIRHIRLEKALELIETTDMNISEIVYSIGLTSRSYFSKIFKNKYKLSPKAYQEKLRSELETRSLVELKVCESA